MTHNENELKSEKGPPLQNTRQVINILSGF